MFGSVKNKEQKKILASLLEFIVNGTKSPAGFAFVPKEEAEKLLKAEPSFVVLDLTVKNASSQIKATATQAAIDALSNVGEVEAAPAEATAPASSPSVAAPATKYQVGVMTGLPPIMRGGVKADSYPFADLAAPQGENYSFFFVPSTEAKPNPAKSLASTVASATKRYASLDKRVFTVRKVTENGVETGAKVIRIA